MGRQKRAVRRHPRSSAIAAEDHRRSDDVLSQIAGAEDIAASVLALSETVDKLDRAMERMEIHIGLISRGIALREVADESRTPPGNGPSIPRLTVPRELPLWMDVNRVTAKIGLTAKLLKRLVDAGHVASAKFGDSRQAVRLYKSADILEALDRIGTGHEPRRKTPGS